LNNHFNNIKVTEELKEKTLKKAKRSPFISVKAVAAILVCVLGISLAAVPFVFNGEGSKDYNNSLEGTGSSGTHLYEGAINGGNLYYDGALPAPEEALPAPGDSFRDESFSREDSDSLDVAVTSKPSVTMPSNKGLTAGKLNDNTALNEQGAWLNPLSNMANGYDSFGLNATKRIAVTVKSPSGEPVREALVTLYDGNIVIFSAITNKQGVAYLFYDWSSAAQDLIQLVPDKVTASKDGMVTEAALTEKKESITVTLQATSFVPSSLDVMFVIDATGSMGDELTYLKYEVQSMLTGFSTNLDTLASINFYRDNGDEFVVRSNPFTVVPRAAVDHFKDITADGGGDMPEAVHSALEDAINNHQWRKNSVKIMFLVLDAQAHTNSEVASSLKNSVEKAAEMGIRIVPVLSSGAGEVCEIMCRELALFTGGQFVFLTDHSGIGGTHHKPTTSVQYEVKPLITVLKETIEEYV
jgi:Mg-chelatase subunit ChlD